jgi:hypothetical protein
MRRDKQDMRRRTGAIYACWSAGQRKDDNNFTPSQDVQRQDRIHT